MSNKVIVNGVDVIKLIERDTPMKVKHNNFDTYCVKCGNHLFKKPQNHCDECGQRLDWS